MITREIDEFYTVTDFAAMLHEFRDAHGGSKFEAEIKYVDGVLTGTIKEVNGQHTD